MARNRRQGAETERARAEMERKREVARWAEATTPHALWTYEHAFPGRRSEEELRARRRSIYEHAKADALSQAPRAPALKTMHAVLDTMSDLRREEPDMQLVFRPFIDRELAHLRKKDKDAADGAPEAPLSYRANEERQRELAQTLSLALGRVVDRDVMRLSVSADPEPNLPTLNVRYAVLPAAREANEQEGAKGKEPKPGIVVRWKATIDGVYGVSAPYAFELTSAPKADRLAFSLGGAAEAAEVDRILDLAFTEFAERMAEQLTGPMTP